MNKYRISKYNPSLRNENGSYLKNEWTSYNDIGEIFDNNIFTKNDYLLCEDNYCYAVLLILAYFNITEITVRKLEVYFSNSKIKKLLNSKELDFTKEDEMLIDSLFEGKTLKVTDLSSYLKLILRDCFWCEFESEKGSERIEFGQDFYVYIYCDFINKTIVNECKNKGIYIENI